MKDHFSNTHSPTHKKKETIPLGRLVLKGISTIVLIGIFSALLYQGGNLVFSSIEQVRVHGNSILSKEKVVQYLELQENNSWWEIDPYQLSLRLKRHLWIESAIVHRNYMRGLDIYITERKPIAYLKLQHRLFLLCKGNLILKWEGTKQSTWDLPIITTNRIKTVTEGETYTDVGISKALSILRKFEGNPILSSASISEINIDDPLNIELVTLPNGIRIKLGDQKLDHKLQNLGLAMPALQKIKKSLQYIDLRHSSGVVIKKK